ncbi:MAG: glycosyltransferase family 39 protein [Bacteroidales bacterium]|nr:glycosyltransferase family 39 protein [Bacteroidales bacterium]
MTKDKFNWKFCLCCGLFVWFVVNLLQGIFTEIQEDEAYYHLWGEHLAWGYFDHPPMVALMTWLSSKLFTGTLGVRFFTIVASCLSLFVIWKTASFNCLPQCDNTWLPQCDSPTTDNSTLLFFTIACSVVMFNIYGFVATPDASLILFSALFLLVYQRYLEENTWPRVALMGLMMALMVYSKYHAFLFLGLIVLSNLKLLKDGKFYVACLVALALLMPHIIWQVNNGFPSFRYHLSGRSEPFRWSYFLEYLPNQLLVFNPFTFGAVAYVLIKDWGCVRIAPAPLSHSQPPRKGEKLTPAGDFERGLKYILVGFFFFFWLMAFRGHVEPHWTIVCVIPVVVLVYRKALVDRKLLNYTKRFILPSLFLVLAFRFLLLTPLVDRFGYHGKEAYYKAVQTVAGEHPVVFQGSFQRPSLYHYFTNNKSSSLKAYYDRMTQFDLWQFDTAWVGQPVFVCGPVLNMSEVIEAGNQCVEGYLMQRFQSPNRLVTEFRVTNFDDAEPLVLHYGDTIRMDFTIRNPYGQAVDFQNDEMSIGIAAQYLSTNGFGYCFYDNRIVIPPHSTYSGRLFTIVTENIGIGPNELTLGLGDGIASFVTEGSRARVRIME